MTILHFSRSFGGERLGGAERNIYNLVNLLSSVYAEKNIVISDNGIWDYCKSNNTFIKNNFNNLDFFLLLIKNIKTKKISNIHVHSNGYYIFLSYFISLIIQCKLIIKVTRIGEGSLINRNKEKKFSFKLFIKRNLFKLICKSNNVHIHILSKSCLDITKNISKKVIVFPNLIKKGKFNPDLKTKDTFVICSRLIKRKNIDLALDNLINLKNKNKKIYILGDGPELKRLKIKYYRYKSEILFLGYLKNEDINKYYEKAEYFVNLSDSEGMSNSLLEAMSYGCKCIISGILENSYTAENYAIYYEKEDDFVLKIKESLKLDPKEIANYANSKFSIDYFDPFLLRGLYKIDNYNPSCRERQ